MVRSEREGGVVVLTLNRPERHNGWTAEMEEAYFDLLEEAAADPGVRAVVLTGAGRSFCPGLDTGALEGLAGGGEWTRGPRRPLTLPTTVGKPIVCAVNGACAGIGLVTALMCDVRFAARGAKFTTAFARRGLPAEHAVSWVLPRITGQAVALDLLLSGRVVLAEEAHRLGLVNFVTEPDDLLGDATAYAADLAAHCSPGAMAAIKAQVYGDLERGLEESRARAVAVAAELRGRPDFAEGVRSYVERRPPDFDPYPAVSDPPGG